MSGSSILRLIAKKVVFMTSASTEAEHIHLAITFERARHRVLQNHTSFSSSRHQEPVQLSSSSLETRFPSWNPLPGINRTRLSLPLPERTSSIYYSRRKVIYQPTLPRPYLRTVFYLNLSLLVHNIAIYTSFCRFSSDGKGC